jgi:hypothetical protein
VYLGETWTDEAGRLVVLGGRGKSTQLGDNNALILVLISLNTFLVLYFLY